MSKKILRLPGVKTATGLSRSAIYAGVAEGSFPPPISLGRRAVGWLEEEVEAWLSKQIARSRQLALGRRTPVTLEALCEVEGDKFCD